MAILGWFALMIGASLTVVGMGKLSQRISSSWFLGILVGFLGLAALFSLFVCTAFGPMRNTTDNKRPPRTVQQLDNPESAESAPPAPAGGTTVTVLTASSTAAKDKFEKFAASLDVPEEYKTFNEKTYASESKVYEAISAMLNSVDKTTGKKPEVSEVEVFEMTQYLAAEARVAEQKREALSAAEAERIKVDEASRLAAAQKTALPAMPMPSVPATGEPITPAPGGGEPPPGVAATAPTATAVADVSAYEPLFKKKCNACHTYKSVEGKVKNYVRQNRTEYLINWMQKMPNSGITKDDASKIIDYVKGTIKASS